MRVEQPLRLMPSITFRAVGLGLLLIPVNTYFILANYLRYVSTMPTTMSLIYNVVMTLTLLTGFNLFFRRFFPRLALRQGELLTVYVMLSISSAISGHDMMQTLVAVIPHGFWFASAENEWERIFWHLIPRWLTLDQLPVIQPFYDGGSTLYTTAHLFPWWRPILWWTLFLSVLLWLMICLDLLLRKQWIEREKLSYPIVHLPLEMTRPDGRLFRSKMMWIGFGIAGGIDLINGIHAFWPAFPEIPVRKFDLALYFTEKPWSAIGWTPIYILSFSVGLGFLMPLEMSFSLWFFYLFWKGERILGQAMGLQNLPGFPYDGSQGVGAYLALACFGLYGGRRHFIQIWHCLLGQDRFSIGDSPSLLAGTPDNTNYWWPILGLVGGLIFIFLFCWKGGMVFWLTSLYFLIYFLLAIGITRVRAEVGPPTHEMFVANPRQFIIDTLGSRRIPAQSLAMMSLFFSFNRGYRAHPMPHTLEGFKIAEELKIRSMGLAMMAAVVMGILTVFCLYLTIAYQIGANPSLGRGAYDLLRRWLYYSSASETNGPAVFFMLFGFCFTGVIWWARIRLPTWPFHPAGYAVASSIWTFGWLWFSIFISWLIKRIVLQTGGVQLYHRVRPLFYGLLLGQFLVGGGWVLIRLIWHLPVYSFYR
ncbi:hypothetical protein CMK12_13840 [Candidatus Poribacteria bacterium]|nr:hypothetical protein [Candidatus Poribacteria bacterium]MDP6750623.1 hypothetical protein [Candidatus Poribacteria bacterium]MDP6999590.1 hypothetical protein [Candidatus Poribacteria bacterium]